MSATVISIAAARTLQQESAAADDVSEALGHVRELTAKRQRLMLQPEGEELVSAGCAVGCPRCFRTCAVTGIILGWWEKELARLTGASGTVH